MAIKSAPLDLCLAEFLSTECSPAPVPVETCSGSCFDGLLDFQRNSLAAMMALEAEQSTGGVLCDKMGLGKTVLCIRLIASSRGRLAHPAGRPRPRCVQDSCAPPPPLSVLAARALRCAPRLDRYRLGQNEIDQLNAAPPPFYRRRSSSSPASPAASRPQRSVKMIDEFDACPVYMSRATLIVLPSMLIVQWLTEMKTHTAGLWEIRGAGPPVLVRGVPNRIGLNVLFLRDRKSVQCVDPRLLCQVNVDVVVVAADAVSSALVVRKRQFQHIDELDNSRPDVDGGDGGFDPINALSRVHWRRLIVDEGHSLSLNLQRYITYDFGWIVSGTPVPSSPAKAVKAVKTALRFVGVRPSALVDNLFTARSSPSSDRALIRRFFLRNTDAIVDRHLPTVTHSHHFLLLKKHETARYNAILCLIKANLELSQGEGVDSILHNPKEARTALLNLHRASLHTKPIPIAEKITAAHNILVSMRRGASYSPEAVREMELGLRERKPGVSQRSRQLLTDMLALLGPCSDDTDLDVGDACGGCTWGHSSCSLASSPCSLSLSSSSSSSSSTWSSSQSSFLSSESLTSSSSGVTHSSLSLANGDDASRPSPTVPAAALSKSESVLLGKKFCSSKIDRMFGLILRTVLENRRDNNQLVRVIIFSDIVDSVAVLLEALDLFSCATGVPFLEAHGKTAVGPRSAAIARFNADTKEPILILLAKTGVMAHGLNVQQTDRIIFMDRCCSKLSIISQAVGRARRLGRTKTQPVHIDNLVAAGVDAEDFRRRFQQHGGGGGDTPARETKTADDLDATPSTHPAPKALSFISTGAAANGLTRQTLLNSQFLTKGDEQPQWPSSTASAAAAAAARGSSNTNTTNNNNNNNNNNNTSPLVSALSAIANGYKCSYIAFRDQIYASKRHAKEAEDGEPLLRSRSRPPSHPPMPSPIKM